MEREGIDCLIVRGPDNSKYVSEFFNNGGHLAYRPFTVFYFLDPAIQPAFIVPAVDLHLAMDNTRIEDGRAYAMAGIGADDVDVAEIYNSFAIQEPLGIEGLGFAEKGRGWAGAADGSTWIDGKVAINLSGGLLCKGHPLGATGTTQAVDIVEQLRGTAPADMQRPDASIGVSACRGGPGAVGAIHVYQRLEG